MKTSVLKSWPQFEETKKTAYKQHYVQAIGKGAVYGLFFGNMVK